MAGSVAMETRLWNSESQLIIWLHLIKYHLSACERLSLGWSPFWIVLFVLVSHSRLFSMCPVKAHTWALYNLDKPQACLYSLCCRKRCWDSQKDETHTHTQACMICIKLQKYSAVACFAVLQHLSLRIRGGAPRIEYRRPPDTEHSNT